jgi:hypothetical protein
MPSTVGGYQQSPFTTPVDGAPNSASDVLNNDEALRARHNAHDADPGVHIQSSATGARPSAGTAGRLWYTTDDERLWRDTGSVWASAGYALTSHTHSAADLTSGTLPDARFPATLPAASGANLTALNATQLTAGTVPGARLAGAYAGITQVGTLATLAVSGAATVALARSSAGSTSVPDAVATTLFTLPGPGGYVVQGSVAGVNETFLAIIVANDAQVNVHVNQTANLTISQSAGAVQVTQASGGTQTVDWSYLRIPEP